MLIAETHERVNFILNKDIGQYVSPEDIDNALDEAQRIVFTNLLPAKRTTQIHDYLNVFVNNITFTDDPFNLTTARYGTGTGSILVLPPDYKFLQSVYLSSGQRVNEVTLGELPEVLSSKIIAPTVTRPVFVFAGQGGTLNNESITGLGKIQIYPSTQGYDGKLWYLRNPATPFFSYTVSGDSTIHNPGASVNLEWIDEAVELFIIPEALKYLKEHLQMN